MRLLVMLALLAAPVPAAAGLKATYTDPSQQKLEIEVADNGDIRIGGLDPSQYGLIKSGQFYVVGREDDKWKVARIEDVAAAFSQVSPPLVKELFGGFAKAPARPATLKIEEKGKQTHLGREGVLLIVHDPNGRPNKPTRLLVSRDDDLKPLGKALEQFTLSFFVLMGGLVGPTPPEEVENMRTMFALGTPLDVEDGFKLIALQEAEIAPERMAFPARLSTVEEIVAETKVRPLTEEEMAQPD